VIEFVANALMYGWVWLVGLVVVSFVAFVLIERWDDIRQHPLVDAALLAVAVVDELVFTDRSRARVGAHEDYMGRVVRLDEWMPQGPLRLVRDAENH
jgi:hypothetical protein